MKKLYITAVSYCIFGLLAGVFYREFTKWNEFTGKTVLSVVHSHIFVLGMVLFLLLMALNTKQDLLVKTKSFSKFYWIYNIGLLYFVIMLLVKGILQVLQIAVNPHMIAGLNGLGHLVLTMGIFYLFKMIYEGYVCEH